MVVTVCSMEKSSEYPLLKIPVKKLGLGHDISFANGDRTFVPSKVPSYLLLMLNNKVSKLTVII